MNSDLITYYQERAKEYESVYHKPERQEELAHVTRILQEQFKDRHVLELACGTGWWTEKIAHTAKSILATDVNESVLEIAVSKKYSPAQVQFRHMDIFKNTLQEKHESLLGGFIWSHIKLEELEHFIDVANSMVEPGGKVVFIDNNYVDGSNWPVTKTDERGNTYQLRNLENGTLHSVLKNFPTESFLRTVLQHRATDINFINLKYYWILEYRTPLTITSNQSGQTLQQALTAFFEKHNLGEDGGLSKPWAKLNFGWFYVPFPNTKSRKRALVYHDIHHIVTGYDSTWKGEAEIGTWEVSSNCGDYYAAWVLDLWAMALGLWVWPKAVFKAFIRGRRTRNLYTLQMPHSQALNMQIGQMQRELHLDKTDESPATTTEIRAFIGWSLVALLFAFVVFALPYILLAWWLLK